MANKKHWYYILVFTNDGPKYVTKIGEGKTAFWNKYEAPQDFTKEYAESIVFGLMCNLYNAVVVSSQIEIETQPYNYQDYKITWASNEEEPEDEE